MTIDGKDEARRADTARPPSRAKLLQSVRAESARLEAARDALRESEELRHVHEDLVRREQELREAKLQTEAANRELEAFSYSVAHDLRAPLRSIDGFSRALLEDHAGALDEVGQRYLRLVCDSAQHMGRLIDDLLALSRVTRAPMRRERVDLGALARATFDRLRRAEPERRVTVVMDGEIWAEADASLVAVVLDNLLGNAWKFTSKRAEARIEVGRLRGAGTPIFYVRDNGAGFDPAYAHKLFGVFERLHSAVDFDGTGVGLATVQRVVSRHGGRAWAEGAVDAGATFYFTLEHGEPPA